MAAIKKLRVDRFDTALVSSNVIGVVPIDSGGTGQTTASAAINALLPSQVSNSGKYLTTNGSVASWVTVSGGAGGGSTVPKITSVQITDNQFTVKDDTAIDINGGYIKISGTDFSSGCSVLIGSIYATSVSFISSDVLHCQIPALSAGTYIVYVINPDGGVAMHVYGLTSSATPSWETDSSLPSYGVNESINIQFAASLATTYSLQSGSSLPSGLSLSSSGLLSGAVTGITDDTLYTFTVEAIDTENQESPRTFSITITIADSYFKQTALLLRTENSTNSFAIDSSANKFKITINGDVKGSKLNPFNLTTSGSAYFDGTGDYLTVADNANLELGSSDFTIETWIYPTANTANTYYTWMFKGPNASYGTFYFPQRNLNVYMFFSYAGSAWDIHGVNSNYSCGVMTLNAWNHIAISREGTTVRGFVNGVLGSSIILSAGQSFSDNANPLSLGAQSGGSEPASGYMSNFRMVVGTALYTDNFTPSASPLTAITNTSLLTVQYGVGTNNTTFLDNSANTILLHRNGNVAPSTFTPFYNNYSVYFDGIDDFLSLPSNSAFAVGTVFTIECWFYPIAQSGNLMMGTVGTAAVQVGWQNSTTFGLASVSTAWRLTSSTLPTLNSWNHVAVVRSGLGTNETQIYLNGVSIASGTVSDAWTSSTGFTIGGASDSTSEFTGYISNVRLVKGTAVYTINFTPSEIPLTAIGGTSLLTCKNNRFMDESTNNFSITQNGDAKITKVTPFKELSKYNPTTHGSSLYFDGTSDWLNIDRVSAGSSITLGTSDFTIEAWIYPTASSSGARVFFLYGNVIDSVSIEANTSTGAVAFSFRSTNQASVTITNSTGIAKLNTWSHVAFVRNGTTLYGFVNGVSSTTTISASASLNESGTGFYNHPRIGAKMNADGNYFPGFISDFRIVKNVALYTQNFTVPNSPSTNDSNTVLLVSNKTFDGAIYDSTGKHSIETFGNASLSNTVTKNLTSCMAFDGTGDYLTIPQPQGDIALLVNGDFTIETWIYMNATPGSRAGIASCRTNGGNNGWNFSVDSALKAKFWYGVSPFYTVTSTTSVTLNTWVHIAVTRSGSTFTLYFNGVSDATTGSVANGAMTYVPAVIGAEENFSNLFNGFIEDLRITPGVVRYTSTFTPEKNLQL